MHQSFVALITECHPSSILFLWLLLPRRGPFVTRRDASAMARMQRRGRTRWAARRRAATRFLFRGRSTRQRSRARGRMRRSVCRPRASHLRARGTHGETPLERTSACYDLRRARCRTSVDAWGWASSGLRSRRKCCPGGHPPIWPFARRRAVHARRCAGTAKGCLARTFLRRRIDDSDRASTFPRNNLVRP